MFEKLLDMLGKKEKKELSLDEAAKLLKTDKAALEAFEQAYQDNVLSLDPDPETELLNAKQASSLKHQQDEKNAPKDFAKAVEETICRVVKELVPQTKLYVYDGEQQSVTSKDSPSMPQKLLTNGDLKNLPIPLRPDLTGTMARRDIQEPAYLNILFFYQKSIQEKDPKRRKSYYDMFRAGLDLLDIDDITCAIIDQNKASMGYWLPKLVDAAKGQKFFRIPKTKIAKVPPTLLQLTRLDYGTLSPTTMAIVDRWAYEVFGLDETKDYFIKTGIFSSKFDFRNAHVHGAKEVRELGEYLLFIHHQAVSMASLTNIPPMYGAATTTEWVVREFIEDIENAPTIYKGLPLHTEYRVFIDCDEDKVLCVVPYWDPQVMKDRFTNRSDADSPHQRHDFVTYSAHEEVIMARYEANAPQVVSHIENDILPWLDLPGQWSLDIMQNSDDFWMIDMAPAEQSFYYDRISAELRRPAEEKWLPEKLIEI